MKFILGVFCFNSLSRWIRVTVTPSPGIGRLGHSAKLPQLECAFGHERALCALQLLEPWRQPSLARPFWGLAS